MQNDFLLSLVLIVAISSVSSEQQHKRSLRQQYRRRHQELQALKQVSLPQFRDVSSP